MAETSNDKCRNLSVKWEFSKKLMNTLLLYIRVS